MLIDLDKHRDPTTYELRGGVHNRSHCVREGLYRSEGIGSHVGDAMVTNGDKFSETNAQADGGSAAALEIALELAALVVADFIELFFELLSDPFSIGNEILGV